MTYRRLVLVLLLGLTGIGAAARANDSAFMTSVNASMVTMMDGMNVRPSGDVDRDFVAMMVAHHQGAIAMARAELRYGRNARLAQIARDIVVRQEREIIAMRRAVGAPHRP